jgi:hypothetical protein
MAKLMNWRILWVAFGAIGIGALMGVWLADFGKVEAIDRLAADAGLDQTVRGPSPVRVRFDGRESVTESTDIISYKWYSQWGTLRAEGETPTFKVYFGNKNPKPGTTRRFRLVVEDGEGKTAQDWVTIMVGSTFTADIRVRKFALGATDSQYLFSRVMAVYEVVNDYDNQKITVGLIAEPDAEIPLWYVNSSSEGGEPNIYCALGGLAWTVTIDDGEGQRGGCLGPADFLEFNKSYKVKIVPFSDLDGDDGWFVLINGIHLADVKGEGIDHTQDRFLRRYRSVNARSCSAMLDRPPQADCDE